MQSGTTGAKWRGRLQHGNPSGDPSKSPRCGAKTRSGAPCRAPAMFSRKSGNYTRCRLHGGASTGPRTREGRDLCRRANWRHGNYSVEARARRRAVRLFLEIERVELQHMERMVRLLLRADRHAKTEKTATFVAILATDDFRDQVSGPR